MPSTGSQSVCRGCTAFTCCFSAACFVLFVACGRLPSSQDRPSIQDRRAAGLSPAAESESGNSKLLQHCAHLASKWQRRMGAEFAVVTRAAFVVTGDISRADLDRWTRDMIEPASAALSTRFGVVPPSVPITVMLFQSEHSYRKMASMLFGDTNVSSLGYYKPTVRTILVNSTCGEDALYHELTHALIDSDFPEAPVWLHEGLATMHEAGWNSTEPRPRWCEQRLSILRRELSRQRLGSLSTLMTTGGAFRGPNEAVNYAHAYYLCEFLWTRGRLSLFYQRMRGNNTSDRSGRTELEQLFPGQSLSDVEDEFRRWIISLQA